MESHGTLLLRLGDKKGARERARKVAIRIPKLTDCKLHLDWPRGAWREETGEMADVISLKFTEPAIGPGGRPIDLRLLGYDLHRLKEASTSLQEWLNGYRGVLDLSDEDWSIAANNSLDSAFICVRMAASVIESSRVSESWPAWSRRAES